MNEILLSDWTLEAFSQGEEERRRKEQSEAPIVSSQNEKPRSSETLHGDWTIAALQKRFSTLEQRIATLERREEAQRRREAAEAANISPMNDAPRLEDTRLDGATLIKTARTDDEQTTRKHPRFDEPRNEFQKAEIVMLDMRDRLERNCLDVRPVGKDESSHPATNRNRGAGVISFLLTAFLAGALGFGAALYVTPIEKATHFRALIEGAPALAITQIASGRTMKILSGRPQREQQSVASGGTP